MISAQHGQSFLFLFSMGLDVETFTNWWKNRHVNNSVKYELDYEKY